MAERSQKNIKKDVHSICHVRPFFCLCKYHQRRGEHTDKPDGGPNEGFHILLDVFALYGVFDALKHAVKCRGYEKYAEIEREKAKIDQMPLITSAICSPP